MNRFRQLLKQTLTAVLPHQFWLARGPRSSSAVALTFDDGPHPEYTPALLDLLRERDIRATFFVVGREAARHPEIVRRMFAEGHDVGHHSDTHSEPSQTSAATLCAEVRACRNLLQDLADRPCDLFRPPKGKLSVRKICDLWKLRQTIVLWNVDPRDYGMQSPADFAEWCEGYQPRGGDIVLLHDVHPGVLTAVPRLIERIAAQGVGFGPISDWVSPAHPFTRKSVRRLEETTR